MLGQTSIVPPVSQMLILNNGDTLFSNNKCFKLLPNLNMVVFKTQSGIDTALCATNTVNSGATHADMQADGNFVLYNAGNQAVWSSQTPNNPGAYLVMQNDGNLVIYSKLTNAQLWATGTSGTCP